MLTFNQWMAHIYRELGYPETTIIAYEQNTRRETTIPYNKQWSEQDRRATALRKNTNLRIVKKD